MSAGAAPDAAQPADQLIVTARNRLSAVGIETPGTDARLLLAHVLGLSHKELSLQLLRGFDVPAEQAAEYEQILQRRLARIPLQHLTGRVGFRHLELQVGPGVFIPRPETELLLEPALSRAAALRATGQHEGNGQPRRLRILDMCTGSAALALAAATEIPGSEVHAVELSAEALSWAQRNLDATAEAVAAAGSTLTLHAGDIAEVVPALGSFDIVLSNPPYVPQNRPPETEEVTGYDPQLALYGGSADGMAIPAQVISLAAAALNAGGLLCIEHDETQGPAIVQACREAGMRSAHTHSDYTGRDRFTTAERREGP
ncbi:peptide chain release factor N(5)-glutamine methyltransferase [Brevibacterium otitidis]|uniref:Release factor glutamine methyltransferase n=1 Tax=Brevibacterium otitidis TaxID=53364 RepID=A0ABV5X5E6_9MICO|nr:peptide chain release factor N(5)-glutamine methyltransferase [Brevibacterium otitidis]